MKDQDGFEYMPLDQITDEDMVSGEYDAPGRLIAVACVCGATSNSVLILGNLEPICDACGQMYERGSDRITVSEYRSYRIVP
jgi:hypothetical protein